VRVRQSSLGLFTYLQPLTRLYSIPWRIGFQQRPNPPDKRRNKDGVGVEGQWRSNWQDLNSRENLHCCDGKQDGGHESEKAHNEGEETRNTDQYKGHRP